MAKIRLTTVVVLLYILILFKETESATYDLYNTKIATSDLKWKKEPRNSWEEVSGFDEHNSVIRSYQVCQLDRSVKNNWVRSPFIKTRGAERINIEIEFSIARCDWPGVDTDYCRQTFNLFYYESQKDVATSTFPPWQERPYIKVDTVAANSNDEVNKKTFTVDSKLSNGGIYIAAQDQGACMSLISIRVFYYYCPETTQSLAQFAQTMTGQKTGSLVTVPGICVDNADINGPIEPRYYCGINGEWQIITGSCRCNAGNEPNADNTSCLRCRSGTYKITAGNGKCTKCPANSGLVDEKILKTNNEKKSLMKIILSKLESCRCHSGFARAEGEGINLPCSTIPFAPNFSAKTATSTNVSITWKKPLDLGGRNDLYYSITCEYCSTSEGSSCRTCPDKVSYTTQKHHFEDVVSLSSLEQYTNNKINIINLEPYTQYRFKIFSENGVSTSSGLEPNYILVKMITNESVPAPVTNIYVADTSHNAVIINWKSPSNPGGIILGYEVEVTLYEIKIGVQRPNEKADDEINKAGTHILMTIKSTGSFSNLKSDSEYSVRIRAKTSVGFGRYSAQVVFKTSKQNKDEKDRSDNDSGIGIFVGTISAVLLLTIICSVLVFVYSRRKPNRCMKNKTKMTKPQNLYGNDRYDEVVEKIGNVATKKRKDTNKNGQTTYVEHRDPRRAVQRINKEINPLNLRLHNTIGEGEFAVVYRATLIEEGEMKTVAAKQLKEGASSKDQSNFLKEACTMAQFDHPNILQLKGVITEHKPEMIISELVENGSLGQFLQSRKGELAIPQLLHMLRGIAYGMQYLSEMQFVHRDLAARNILVNSDLVCKVSDFGLSRTLENENHPYGTYKTQGGKIALRWTAPECIRLREFTSASDVWSYGIVMWEVMSYGEKPYWSMTNDDVMQSINSGLRLPAPNNCPKSIHELMLECWSLDPTRRPTFIKIVSDLNKLIRHSSLLQVKSEEQMEQSVCYSPDRREEVFNKSEEEDFYIKNQAREEDVYSESDSSSISQDGTCSSVVINEERCLSV